jgi:pimeloyl-ACP methyl ester carboxylesterase
MTMQTADVNGIKLAFDVRGAGPPLLLIMGYRLNSSAWPSDFIDGLAKRFTLILFDNRGTGQSEKPTSGYALSNMAKDAGGLMDHLGLKRAHVFGYSMGGAIAQELACNDPDRVDSLVLCATLCGGLRASYAQPAVISIMHDLDGLEPAAAARRIWTVTYEPNYLAANQAKIELQMQREIQSLTPLHAADLQFQAFADFDLSQRISSIRAPTLVMTGDRDLLIPPNNAKILAELIPDASLSIIQGCAHRVVWEAADRCVAEIGDFLTRSGNESDAAFTHAG